MDRDLYRRCPFSYAVAMADEHYVSYETLARAFMYHLSHDQIREVLEDNELSPRVECHACNDLFAESDGEDLEITDGGERFFCQSCIDNGDADEYTQDEEETHSCGCGETLNEDNECPKCSLDPEY